jgi:hypothetical protein
LGALGYNQKFQDAGTGPHHFPSEVSTGMCDEPGSVKGQMFAFSSFF